METNRFVAALGTFLVALFVGAAAAPLHAQEVGLYITRGSSNLPEFGSPDAMGLSFRVFPTANLGVRVAAHRGTHRYATSSRVCQQYIPPLTCGIEGVDRSTTLRRLELSGSFRYSPIDFLEFDVGAGGTLNEINGSDDTVSGRPSALFVRQTMQVGGLLIAGVRARPAPGLPLVLEAGFSQHFTNMDACAFEEYQDDPYCGTLNLREFRLGLAWRFGS